MATAIVTRYLGPTDFRGARVVAQSHSKRKIVSWNHALDSDKNHSEAADEAFKGMGSGVYEVHRCDLPGGKGARVHVYVKKRG